MLLKKLKDLLDIKTQNQTYLEYKQTIQFILDIGFIDFMFADRSLVDFR